jgi:DNA-binding MarR family transcriptional regulator
MQQNQPILAQQIASLLVVQAKGECFRKRTNRSSPIPELLLEVFRAANGAELNMQDLRKALNISKFSMYRHLDDFVAKGTLQTELRAVTGTRNRYWWIEQ